MAIVVSIVGVATSKILQQAFLIIRFNRLRQVWVHSDWLFIKYWKLWNRCIQELKIGAEALVEEDSVEVFLLVRVRCLAQLALGMVYLVW